MCMCMCACVCACVRVCVTSIWSCYICSAMIIKFRRNEQCTSINNKKKILDR